MLSFLPLLLLVNGRSTRPLYHPDSSHIQEAYRRADTINRDARTKVAMLALQPNWIQGGSSFWYRRDELGGKSEFIRVDARTGAKTPAFDAVRLARHSRRSLGRLWIPSVSPSEASAT